ncbi:CstA-like transporter-associated (seleno)protein [Novosphingobium sp. Fuku2-ISO-50]|uniref:CstA-like transporter-associated (seleno)protein n=1 Tax=Novosphingobium sp. Fuku2-ISO-50 TaxID=1739114 RepID=UPI00076CAF70|nr:CstA-like transporter-associated (seleno)protein [Novosphingobium sp. Fuku2-ISO-50]KUR77575.1 hypothetical protein AQZ50_10430 [Novosphingobium sp. Fuku2-ISO-50]
MRSPIRTFVYALLGLGDYDAYCAHIRECQAGQDHGGHDHGGHDHGGRAPMTRAEFIRNREAHKFGGGRGGRCC